MLNNTNNLKTQKESEIALLESESDWCQAAKVLQTLRPNLNIETFLSSREQLRSDGYKLLGLRAGGELVSIASFTISPHAELGRELLIHDMATLPAVQGQGFASKIIDALIKEAESSKCGRIFVHTKKAMRLYAQNGFAEYSTGMIRKTEG